MTQQSIIGERPIAALLVGALQESDPIVRARAAEALGRKNRGAITGVSRLARMSLEDGDSAVRAAAVNALLRLRISAGEIRDNAVALLSHPARDVRARAGWTLGRLEPAEIEPAIHALGVCLDTDPDSDPKFGALWAFARMRSADPAVLAILECTLADADGDVRSEAARVLGRIGPGAAKAVPALCGLLDDPDPLARGNAARAIGLIGKRDSAVCERLRTSCGDGMDYVRAAAAGSLARLSETTPEMSEPTREDPWRVQAPTVDELMSRLEGDDAFRRAEAAWLLAKSGGRAEIASNALALRAVVDPDSDARWAALYALARIGRPSPELVETLAEILGGDVDPDVRQGAAAALGVLWSSSPAVAVAALAASLDDEDPMVRDEAADSIYMIGQPAVSARPSLEAALVDSHAGVRARVAAALNSIGGPEFPSPPRASIEQQRQSSLQ